MTEYFSMPIFRLFSNSRMLHKKKLGKYQHLNQAVPYQYPVYSPVVNNYQNDVVYDVEIKKKSEGQYLVTQKVTGKSSFIYQALKDKKAEFGITYKIKESLNRITHGYPPTRDLEQEIIGEYLIEDIPEGLSFTLLPFIFLLEKEKISISPNNTYGLDKLWWQYSSIIFPQYAKIAHSLPIDSSNVDDNLPFIIQRSKSLQAGQLKVEFDAHNAEKPFHVKCAKDVFHFLKGNTDEHLKRAIENQILVGAFSELKSYYQAKEEDGSSGKLDLLKASMKEQGIEDWTVDDFNPSEAATKLHPLKIPKLSRPMVKYYLYSKEEYQKFGQGFLDVKKGDEYKYNHRNDFFKACKNKATFLGFIGKIFTHPSGNTPPPIPNIKLTEQQFIKPPEEIQREIYTTYKDVPDQYVHDPTFWFYANLEMIKEDIIEPSFLANDNNLKGKQKLDILINDYDDNNQDYDTPVRQILRRLCNTEPRGKRTLIEPNDCPISGVYWRQALIARIEEVSEGKLKAKEISSQFNMDLYGKICEQLFSSRSYYGDPKVLAGLVIFLKNKTGIKKDKVESLLKEMGKIIAWKAIDLASIDEIAQEFNSLYKINC